MEEQAEIPFCIQATCISITIFFSLGVWLAS